MTRAALRSGRPAEPWLLLARGLWLALLLLSVGILAAATWVDPSFASALGWPREAYQAAAEPLGVSTAVLDAIHQTLATVTRLGFIGMGLLLFWRKGREPFALFVSIFLITFSVTAVFVGQTAQSHPWIGPSLNLVQAVGQACLVVFLYLFPDGRWVPRWTGWPTVVTAAHLLAARFEVLRSWPLYTVLQLPAILWFFGCIPAQIYRYRRVAGAAQRQQIKWGVFGIALFILMYGGTWMVFGYWLPQMLPALQQQSPEGLRYEFVRAQLMSLAALSLPVSLGVAILRYRLWDIDVIIRRALIYSALSAVLALAYFGTVLVLESVFRFLTGQGQNSLTVVLSTLAIAALFGPLRARVQRVIDRRFFRQKYNAARTLAGFAVAARDEVDLDRLSAQLVHVVDETMQPKSISLWLRQHDGRSLKSVAPAE